MQDNNIAVKKGWWKFELPDSSRVNAIMKRWGEIIKEHPEIVLKPGVYAYNKAPPEVQAEIEELFYELNDLHVEEVIWKIGIYYSYLQNNPSEIDVSLAEDLLTDRENGTYFIPDVIIKDILNRFPELKEKHPKIQEILNTPFIIDEGEREFSFIDIHDDELQPLVSEIENLAKAEVRGIMFERKAGFVHINYERAHPDVKKVLDEIVEKIGRKLLEIMIKDTAIYYHLMTENPSLIKQNYANAVLLIKSQGVPVPDVVVIDALNRFRELRNKYPEIVKEYKKFLK